MADNKCKNCDFDSNCCLCNSDNDDDVDAVDAVGESVCDVGDSRVFDNITMDGNIINTVADVVAVAADVVDNYELDIDAFSSRISNANTNDANVFSSTPDIKIFDNNYDAVSEANAEAKAKEEEQRMIKERNRLKREKAERLAAEILEIEKLAAYFEEQERLEEEKRVDAEEEAFNKHVPTEDELKRDENGKIICVCCDDIITKDYPDFRAHWYSFCGIKKQ